MVSVVLDSSAVLAHLFEEPGGNFDPDLLFQGLISTVNLAEVISRLVDRGAARELFDLALKGLSANAMAFDAALAEAAGRLRESTRPLGLSLGDRACLALAIREKLPVLTADQAWKNLDIGVEVRLIR